MNECKFHPRKRRGVNRTTCPNRLSQAKILLSNASEMHVACEFLVRECTRGVATTRHICPTSYTARNNEPVIGILGRVCISIQDVVASPIDVTTFQSNSPFASFHDLHFPSALAFPPRQFLPTRRVLCTHVIYKKEKLASSITKERMRKFVKSFDRRDQHLRILRLLLPFQKESNPKRRRSTQLFLRHRVDLLGIIVLNAQATLSTFSIFRIHDRSYDRFSSRRQIIKRKVSALISFFLSFFLRWTLG